MSARSRPSRPSTSDGSRNDDRESGYYFRRALSARELMPAIAVGVGAGLVGFYLTRLLLERTPLPKTSRAGARSSRSPRVTAPRPNTPAADPS
jgi:hypothetical protein